MNEMKRKIGGRSLGNRASFIVEKMKKKVKKTNVEIQYETCICCHKQLDIPVDREIDARPFYIEGAGQLCYDCFHKVYK